MLRYNLISRPEEQKCWMTRIYFNKNLACACVRGLRRVESCHPVAPPVLEECVCYNQPIHGTQIQQTYAIFILLLRSKRTNGSPPSHCIILHSGIEILHDQQHITSRNLLHILLELFLKKLLNPLHLQAHLSGPIQHNEKKASVGLLQRAKHPFRHRT